MKYELTVTTKNHGVFKDIDEVSEEDFQILEKIILEIGTQDTFHIHDNKILQALPKGVIQGSIFKLERI